MNTVRQIECNMGIDYRDVPPWRSYEMTAQGRSLEEMLEDASISEVDQDGGEIRTYGLEGAPNEEVLKRAEKLIAELFQEAK